MLTGTAPALPENEETMTALACILYEQGAWAESFRLLLRLSAAGRKTAPLFYNQALCFEQAGQTDKALSCLTREKREPQKTTGEEETMQILYGQQCDRGGYRFPMRDEEAVCLPAYARERIIRLMIDLCAKQNDGTRVKSLAASLLGKQFENVEKALLQTSGKEN